MTTTRAVMLGARTCTVVADLSVLGLTLLNTWSLRGHGGALGVKTTFSQTLMRSGAYLRWLPFVCLH
ncbi:hypothetical protein TRAPUB_9144 [Trametes pubescens]|uniref:Uncharacterized protein n=1 Tax=Trametes pubescens TaxID=154538 RepID=A0A1M2W344_TRAPU|nr:hypothetical protein TRAPUB_9144 [Trametes pubescens]